MPAGRFDFIGEAARFAPSAGSVTVRFIGVEPGLAFVATRASATAWHGYLRRSLRRIPPATASRRIAPTIHGHGVGLVFATVGEGDGGCF